MATVTQHEVAPLHKKLQVTIQKGDYLPSFEKALKEYSKKANIPGFRKGMVPTGLIKKMYGSSLFTDEVLKRVDQEVNNYLQTEKADIIGQPLPLDFDLAKLDMNQPTDYEFSFEMGLRPDFQLPNLSTQALKRYKVDITPDLVEEEVERLRSRYGNMTEPEAVSDDENVLNITFIETDAAGNGIEGGIRKDNSVLVKYFRESLRPSLIGKKTGDEIQTAFDEAFEGQEAQWILQDLGIDSGTGRHFKLQITKVGLVEKRELNEEFFTQLFPNGEIKTEEDFRSKIKSELEKQWEAESKNQLQHQLYHVLLNGTHIDLPQDFLKRWVKTQGEEGKTKSDEQIEQEFPTFLNQLKWNLITDKMAQDGGVQVSQEDLRQFAKDQLLGYMGMGSSDEEQDWVRDYIDRMMKDRKYIDDASQKIYSQKLMDWAESQVAATETSISKEEFIKMNQEHQHEH
ncbi:MAG: trigger factor [Flaviaesturariibacter sp.]|nr:trigger factor [Flaviaesturariibacter sp.]